MAFRFNPLPKKKKATPVSRRSAKQSRQSRVGRVAFGLLVGAAVLALAFFLVLRTSNQVSIAENAVGTLLSPIQRAFSSATIFVRDTVNGVKDYFYITDELARTKAELTETQIQLQEYREAAAENDRLKGVLQAKERYGQLDPLYARVTGKNPGVWFDVFEINVGTNDGVQANMAVLANDASLVGHVFEVGATYAKVMTLVNEESAVACLIERTRESGMMYGPTNADADDKQCQMRYLPDINDVTSGDVVITSGLDRLYPKGLKVGEVTRVSRQQSDESDRYVMVQPSADFLRLEEVVVLRVNVATDEDVMSEPLLTATPRPTPSETPAPSATPDANATIPGLEEEFHWPSGTVDPEGNVVVDPETGAQQQSGTSNGNNMLIEDEWAR